MPQVQRAPVQPSQLGRANAIPLATRMLTGIELSYYIEAREAIGAHITLLDHLIMHTDLHVRV